MHLNDYQKQAMLTAIFPEESRIVYPALGLGNEAGEYQGKVKKLLRGDKVELHDLKAELGDVLWYLAACAEGLDTTLGEIAAANLAKLKSRQERGTLQGNGDNR